MKTSRKPRPLPLMQQVRTWWDGWASPPTPFWERISRRNPFYLASAACMLLGAYLAIGPERFTNLNVTLVQMGILEGYQILILLTAVILLRKHGPRWDAVSLLGVGAVFLLDAALFHLTFGAVDPWLGLVLGLAGFILAGAKIAGVLVFSGLSRKLKTVPLGVPWFGGSLLFLIHLGPSLLGLSKLHTTTVCRLAPLVLLMAVPLAVYVYLYTRRCYPAEGLPRGITLLILRAAPLAVVVQALAWAYVFYGEGEGGTLRILSILFTLLLVWGPALFMLFNEDRKQGWQQDYTAWAFPAACVITAGVFTLALQHKGLPLDLQTINPFSVTCLSCAGYFFLAWRRFDLGGPFAPALLIFACFFALDRTDLLEQLIHPSLPIVLTLHLPLGLLIFWKRNSAVTLMSTAVLALAWTGFLDSLVGGGEPTTLLFTATQLFLILALPLSLLLHPDSRARTWILGAALGGALTEIVAAAGLQPQLHLVCLALAAVALGVRFRDWILAGLGGITLAADGLWTFRGALPRDVQGFGVLFLAGGFFIFLAGLGVSLFIRTQPDRQGPDGETERCKEDPFEDTEILET